MEINHYCSNCESYTQFLDGTCLICGSQFGHSNHRIELPDISHSIPNAKIDLQPDDYLIKRFIIKKKIDQGKFNSIYLATDTIRSENVALQVVEDSPFTPVFVTQKVHSMKKINDIVTDYQHVLKQHDIYYTRWEGIGLILLSMEYADRGSLKSLLEQQSHSTGNIKIEYFKQICRGIQAIHQSEGLLLTLTPDKILFIGETIKVAGAWYDRKSMNMPKSESDTWLKAIKEYGTHHYLAPEIFTVNHIEEFDERTDIFSLGILLKDMLSINAFAPCEATTYERIVSQCVEKLPEHRFSDIAHLLNELEHVANTKDPMNSQGDYEKSDNFEEERMESARSALIDKNFDAAKRLCQSIIEKQPNHKEAQEMLCTIRDMNNRVEQIYKIIEQNIEHKGLEELTALLKNAVDLYPNHPAGFLIQNQLELKSQNFKRFMREGLESAQKGFWEAALEDFTHAQKINPSTPCIHRIKNYLNEAIETRNSKHRQIEIAIQAGNLRKVSILSNELEQYIKEISFQLNAVY